MVGVKVNDATCWTLHAESIRHTINNQVGILRESAAGDRYCLTLPLMDIDRLIIVKVGVVLPPEKATDAITAATEAAAASFFFISFVSGTR
jgi:hypothetical protein